MKQGKEFIRLREKARQYISFAKIFGNNTNTYQKLSGFELNGERDGDLNEKNIEEIVKKGTAFLQELDESVLALEKMIELCTTMTNSEKQKK